VALGKTELELRDSHGKEPCPFDQMVEAMLRDDVLRPALRTKSTMVVSYCRVSTAVAPPITKRKTDADTASYASYLPDRGRSTVWPSVNQPGKVFACTVNAAFDEKRRC